MPVSKSSALLVLSIPDVLPAVLFEHVVQLEGCMAVETAGRGLILIPYLVMSAFVTLQLAHDSAIHSNKL